MFRYQGSVNSAQGPALDGVDVYVCGQPASTGSIPPSPLSTLYTDSTGATQLANPVQTDGLGNFFFYAPTGIYTLVYFDPINRIPTTVFPDQQVVSQGGGSVTSVAIKGDGVLFATTVVGSPITSAGTFDLSQSLNNFNANSFLRGPNSGSAGQPFVGPLVAADLVGLGVGTVTSVTAAIVAAALFSASITGTNPITSAGTFTINIAFANQAANTFLAGPASGGTGPISARAQVAADISGLQPVAFSATPVFNAALNALPTFTMTLTGNVTSSSVTNPTGGQRIAFIITQDATGSRTFAWPSNFRGASDIAPAASNVSVQEFLYDGTNWRATSPGSTDAS